MTIQLVNVTKKPIEVTTVMFTGGVENGTDIQNWVRANGGQATWKPEQPPWQSDDGQQGHSGFPEVLQLLSLNGFVEVPVGEIIIRGIKGEFYPCAQDIFAESYENPVVVEEEVPLLIEAPTESVTYIDLTTGQAVSQDVIDAPLQAAVIVDPELDRLNGVETTPDTVEYVAEVVETYDPGVNDPAYPPEATQPMDLSDIPTVEDTDSGFDEKK